MNDEMPEIPEFLRVTPKIAAQSRRDWERNPPKAAPAFVPAPRAADVTAERIAADMEAERRTAALNKIARMKARQEGKAFDSATMRWDPARCRFVTDKYLARQAAKPVDQRAVPKVVKAKATGAVDDLGARVSALGSPDAVRKFAEANGVWDDKYAQLNNGLQRMNVVNRLRGRIKAGHEVVWPGIY